MKTSSQALLSDPSPPVPEIMRESARWRTCGVAQMKGGTSAGEEEARPVILGRPRAPPRVSTTNVRVARCTLFFGGIFSGSNCKVL